MILQQKIYIYLILLDSNIKQNVRSDRNMTLPIFLIIVYFQNLMIEHAKKNLKRKILGWASLIRRFKLKVIFIWFKRFEK